MSRSKRKREWLPPWEMPSDPIKAVWWFMRWLLRVLVRYFWIAIAGMSIFQAYYNWISGGPYGGIIAALLTLLIGFVLWGVLYMLMVFVNISATVSNVMSDMKRVERDFPYRRNPLYPFPEREPEGKIVEGTITDLDEERKRRRQD